MKRVVTILLSALMLLGTVACAEGNIDVHDPVAMATKYEDISGDAYWPIFRGLQWSMNEDVVLLLEKARGVEFEVLRDADDIHIYAVENVQVLGREARLIYRFVDGQGLSQTTAEFAANAEEDIDALLESLITTINDEYGEPITDNRTDGKFDWSSDEDMIVAWGESDEGVRHQSGEKYLIGAVTLEVFKRPDSETMLRLNMQGTLQQAQ